MKETDLFLPVKKWLEEKGYEVYSEVEAGVGRADIVGKCPPAFCVVEMKTTLSHDLIDQAIRWSTYANYIYIAIPRRKNRYNRLPRYLQNIFREYKIGVLEVDIAKNPEYSYCSQYMPARFQRIHKRHKSWDDILREEHKTWLEGGSSGGGYVTSYKLTMHDIREFMRRGYIRRQHNTRTDGWMTIQDILDHCETHYSRPKSSLAQALLNFETEWCESKLENRRRYYRFKQNIKENKLQCK